MKIRVGVLSFFIVLFIVGVGIGLAAIFIRSEVPDENDKDKWMHIEGDDEREIEKEADGTEILWHYKRYYRSIDGKYTLGVHEFLGERVMKAWARTRNKVSDPLEHKIALRENGKWRVLHAEKPEITPYYEGGKLRRIRIELKYVFARQDIWRKGLKSEF